MIDTDCLQIVLDTNLSWHVYYTKKVDGYYACATKYLGIIDGKPKYTSVYLARVVFNCKPSDNIFIDHKNHDTMDNRKENLRVTNNKENTTNRRGKSSNNTSGYRNVSKIGKWWCVQMQVNGKNTMLKKFSLDKVDEAGAYASLMREKYYGEFKGFA